MSLAIAPAAGADDSLVVPIDPTALAAALVEPVAAVPATVDPAALVATVADTVPLPAPAPPPQAVPAAAAEPTPALEPQPTPIGTPPPLQPGDPGPLSQPLVPDPSPVPAAETTAPAPQPAAVESTQYQPEPAQYQPSEPAPVDVAAEADQPAALFAPADAAPPSLEWNFDANFDAPVLFAPNSNLQSGSQYHGIIARYQPLVATVSLLGAAPALAESVAVDANPLADAAEGLAAAPFEPFAPPGAGAPAPDPEATADAAPAKPKPPGLEPASRSVFAATPTTISSRWTPRHATPRQVQPKPEIHRSRSSHRRPTRHPLPPSRAPVIPVSSAGAAPLGGADGGGFHLTLLLAPFALALVDSARRVARDAAPPVERERDKRRKRPG